MYDSNISVFSLIITFECVGLNKVHKYDCFNNLLITIAAHTIVYYRIGNVYYKS